MHFHEVLVVVLEEKYSCNLSVKEGGAVEGRPQKSP
jgi:hypothetical protein